MVRLSRKNVWVAIGMDALGIWVCFRAGTLVGGGNNRKPISFGVPYCETTNFAILWMDHQPDAKWFLSTGSTERHNMLTLFDKCRILRQFLFSRFIAEPQTMGIPLDQGGPKTACLLGYKCRILDFVSRYAKLPKGLKNSPSLDVLRTLSKF